MININKNTNNILNSTEVEVFIIARNKATQIKFRVAFFVYIGVQMAQPFRKDKKSGVMKVNWKNCIPRKSSSRKNVVDSFKTTALQLGARGDIDE